MKFTVLPTAVAVSVVIAKVPPRFRVPVAPFVNPPVPANAVPTVNVPLLVRVTPVTVTLGMERAVEPPIACAFVVKE